MMKIKEILKNIFLADPENKYHFFLTDELSSNGNQEERNQSSLNNSDVSKNASSETEPGEIKNIFPSIDVNLEYVKVK